MKDLKYYKDNCEEDYLHTPISVLRYITELEKEVESKPLIIDSVVGQSEQLPCEHERTRAGHHHDQPHFCLDCGEEL